MILEKINKPNDIKQLSPIEYNQLADEIRRFLIEKISKTGGHLASNLGVVELTMALHLAYLCRTAFHPAKRRFSVVCGIREDILTGKLEKT